MTRGPLLTRFLQDTLQAAARAGQQHVDCSLDLSRTTTRVGVDETGWQQGGRHFPWLADCRDRTIYYWDGTSFAAASRYSTSLVKLVPTDWGPPTFEIDGIKMLPTASVSPFDDAERKVGRIKPRGKVILDTCGGLGYFAGWCLAGGAAQVLSFEKNPDVLWLRSLNPWSPHSADPGAERLVLAQADVTAWIAKAATASVDAILHDPPRFGIAGELYSAAFYGELARLLRPRGLLFHYSGAPNRLTSGRDVQGEVLKRLQQAGFAADRAGDGVLAEKAAGGGRGGRRPPGI